MDESKAEGGSCGACETVSCSATSATMPQTQALKLIVNNFGKRTTRAQVEQFFRKSGIASFKKIKKGPNHDATIVSFLDVASRDQAQQKLSALSFLKNDIRLEVNHYNPTHALAKDAKPGQDGEEESAYVVKSVEDSVAPLRHLTYADQLKKKQKKIVQVLKKVKKEVAKFETKQCHRSLEDLPDWLQKNYMWTPKPQADADADADADAPNMNGTSEQKTEEPSLKKLKSSEGNAVSTAVEAKPVGLYREWNVGPIPGCCCPVDKITAAPQVSGYRNKCEFTIGEDEAGQICVGFRRGRFRDKSVTVAKPTEACMTCSASMIALCQAMEEFLKSSPLAVYSVVDRTGVWRQVTVRSATGNGRKQLLAIVQCRKEGVDNAKLTAELARLKQAFEGTTYDGFTLVSFFVDFYDGHSVNDAPKPETVFGGESLVEELNGMEYIVSPTAFFQTNTKGAESLYNVVKAKALEGLSEAQRKKVVLLDVCCGTGTIGLSMARDVKHVIGIELNAEAVQNARENAARNNIANAAFVAAPAEVVAGQMLVKKNSRQTHYFSKEADKAKANAGEISSQDREEIDRAIRWVREEDALLIAVVDPPRGGLRRHVLNALRVSAAHRVVYVSCNPTGSFLVDAKILCLTENSKRRPGKPFQPVVAAPVDMFPHTDHVELVTVFERVKAKDKSE